MGSNQFKRLSAVVLGIYTGQVLTGPLAWAGDNVSDKIKAQLFVLSPVNLDGTMDLDNLEHPVDPYFSFSESINWTKLEKEILEKLKDAVPSGFSGKAICPTVLCPDIDFKVEFKPDFKLTSTPAPSISHSGDSGNTIKIKVKPKARISLTTKVRTHSSLAGTDHFTIDSYIDISAKLEAKAKLWPDLSVEKAKIDIELEGTNLGLKDPDGAFIAAGISLGALAGMMPVVAFAGPFLPFLGAIGGDEAAKKVKKEVNKQVSNAIEKELKKVEKELNALLKTEIAPAVKEIVDAKKEFLGQKLPSGEKLSDGMKRLGTSIDVRTYTKNSTRVTVAATVRLEDEGKEQLDGILQIPKKQCWFVNNGWVPEWKTASVNTGIAGKSCSSVVDAAQLERRIHLGANPEESLDSGSSSNKLDTWKSLGSLKMTGKALDRGSYYECHFTLDNLPEIAILEFRYKSALATLMYDYGNMRPRVFAGYADSVKRMVVADSKGRPMPYGLLVLGGQGPRTTDDCFNQTFTQGELMQDLLLQAVGSAAFSGLNVNNLLNGIRLPSSSSSGSFMNQGQLPSNPTSLLQGH
jgi:hypothetical protein